MTMEPANPNFWMSPVLANLGVASFEAYLSGSGDSGQLDEVRFLDANGKELDAQDIQTALERIPLHSVGGYQNNFREAFESLIDSSVDHLGNYCDNEGGAIWAKFSIEENQIVLGDSEYTPGSYDDDEDEPDEDAEPDDEDFSDEDLEQDDPAP